VRRSGVFALCLGALVALVSFSASTSGAEEQPQIVAFSQTGDCSGFLLETLTGVVTGCRTVPFENQGGVWSVAADGSMVGNGQNGPGSSAPVTLVRPDGQVVVLDSNPNDFNPSISPDGSKVAFARLVPQDYQGAWPSNIFVMNTDGSGLKQIASGGDSQLDVPTFSPDGSTIAYACQPTFAMGQPGASTGCGPLPDGSRREFATLLVNADGSDTRVILLNQSTQSLSWSADGKWIATESVAPCTCSDGSQFSTEVFMYHTDGSDLFSGGNPSQNINPEPSNEVTHDDTAAMTPQFTAGSSSQLIYYKPVDDSGDFWGHDYMINVDGTDRHELSLSPEGAQYGLIIPAATGGGPPPFVNVMRVPVPSVHSLGYKAAKERLRSAHLRVGRTTHRYSSRIPRNHVIGQKPRGGGYAHRTTRQAPPVKLILSRGPRK
jgi:PASTA domain-containing protein/WD40 repeat protein